MEGVQSIRSLRRAAAAALGTGLCAFASAWAGPSGEISPEAIAGGVATLVQTARKDAGVPALERRSVLDEAAQDRAAAMAALPAERRLAVGETVEVLLERHGVRRYRGAETRTAVLAGYSDPAAEVVALWRDARDSRLLDRAWTALGIGTAAGREGEAVVVAVFVEDAPPLPDLASLEELLEVAVSDERERRGLAPLQPSAALRAVARAHSADMAARGFFDHMSPDGESPADRVRGAGIRFSKMSENIARSFHVDDPVETTVQGWLDSPRHRRNMLDPNVSETAVGAASDEEGRLYVTQIYLAPAE